MVHLSHSIATLIVLVHLCMDTVSPERRIFKGRRVQISEFPFFVIIHYGLKACGGSIISPLWIVTAQHCLIGTGWISHSFVNIPIGLNQYVYAGSDLVNITTMKPMSPGAIERRIKIAVLHPNHDIAVVRLDRPLNFDKTIQPILLPRKGEGDRFSNVSVCGFGTAETGLPSPFLKASEHNFQESDQCFVEYREKTIRFLEEHFNQTVEMNKDMQVKVAELLMKVNEMLSAYPITKICLPKKGGEGACKGDSGGPLVAKRAAGSPVLVGIAESVSLAKSKSGKREVCSDLDSFTFFMRVPSFLEWIYSVAGEELSN